MTDMIRRQALIEVSRIAEGLAHNRGHVLMLNDYQVANLRALLNAIGAGYWPVEEELRSSPLQVCNNGDWVGEIYMMLPYEGQQEPNQSAAQMRRQAQAWKPPPKPKS